MPSKYNRGSCPIQLYVLDLRPTIIRKIMQNPVRHFLKHLSFMAIIAILTTTSNAKEPHDDIYDVYLLIGQSNMAGRATMIAADSAMIPGVWLLNAAGEPEPAKAPLNRYSTIRKAMKMQQIGPGVSFGEIMHQKTGNKILLVVNARGGSSIMSWLPDNDTDRYLEKAESRAKEALTHGKLCGILWHQGETDVERSTPEYAEKFAEIASHLRNELNVADVPIVVGEIGRWGWEAPEKIKLFNDSVLTEVCRLVPNCAKVSSEGLERLYPDNEKDPHFCRDAQLELGKRYAEAILNFKPAK